MSHQALLILLLYFAFPLNMVNSSEATRTNCEIYRIDGDSADPNSCVHVCIPQYCFEIPVRDIALASGLEQGKCKHNVGIPTDIPANTRDSSDHSICGDLFALFAFTGLPLGPVKGLKAPFPFQKPSQFKAKLGGKAQALFPKRNSFVEAVELEDNFELEVQASRGNGGGDDGGFGGFGGFGGGGDGNGNSGGDSGVGNEGLPLLMASKSEKDATPKVTFTGDSSSQLFFPQPSSVFTLPEWLRSQESDVMLLGTPNITKRPDGLWDCRQAPVNWFGLSLIPTFVNRIQRTADQVTIDVVDARIDIESKKEGRIGTGGRILADLMERSMLTGRNALTWEKASNGSGLVLKANLSLTLSISKPKRLPLPPGFNRIGSRIVRRTCRTRVDQNLVDLRDTYLAWVDLRTSEFIY